MSKYLISLTPIGSYFFGGERSFTVGDEDNNELASYIVESNLFPQQTSLLGMLRFWILRNSDAFNVVENKIQDKTRAKELIGEHSFSINGNNDFGVIEKIGFCFLQKKKEKGKDTWMNFLPTPLDYNLDVKFNSQTAFYNKIEKKLPDIKYKNEEKAGNTFSAKEGLEKGYVGLDVNAEDNLKKEKEIFKKDRRIGINRNIKTGKTEDNALYKQISYQLAAGFRFAFTAEFKDGVVLPANGQIVELGGDSSKFILNYEAFDGRQEPTYELALQGLDNAYEKVILLSEAKLENSVVEENTIFSIAEHVPFRFLSFNIDTKSYARTPLQNCAKNNRYSLFKRGSVFYFDDEAKFKKFKEAVDNTVFQQIGYNKYESKKNK